MPDWLSPYAATLAAEVCLAALYLVQMLVADAAGIRAGHVPGMPVTTGHGEFLFRATRAQANTNESLPVFVLLATAAPLLGTAPAWTNGLAWTFVAARLAHSLAYWADRRPLRSAAFAVSLAALLGLLALGVAALL